MKLAPDADFCSTRKDLKSEFGKVTPKGVKKGVKRGKKGVLEGQTLFWLQSSPNLVGRSLITSYEGIFHDILDFSTLSPPSDPMKGSGGSNGGQNSVGLQYQPNLVGRNLFCN